MLLPEEERNRGFILARALEELRNHVDLSRPLTQLSHVIRQGGNLGAHFDLEREPDQNTALMMIELLEFFMEYLFVIYSSNLGFGLA